MQNESKITCPECGAQIDVQDVLKHQVEEVIKKDYDIKLNQEKLKFEEQTKQLEDEKKTFEEKKKKENELFQERLDKRLKEEKRAIKIQLKEKMEEDSAEQFEELQKELNEKSEKIKELNKSKAEIEKLKREKGELRDEIEAESQKKLNETISAEKEKIKKAEQDKNELIIKEYQKKLEDSNHKAKEMQRQIEQGSMQMQGEVQELAIEEWLESHFQYDTITEIKKGAKGADCLQTVNTRERQNCGTIYYESKRTKDFQKGWIEKFKNDIREKGADIGVLVTEAMPSDMERMGMKDGVWICNYEEFKGLCSVLRQSVIQISNTISSQENKGDKMDMLYDYLTGNTFRLQVEAIVEGFTQMRTDLIKEQNSIRRIWKQREKQIEKVTNNTIDMHASIKGIAGNAIQTVEALELPENEEEIEE